MTDNQPGGPAGSNQAEPNETGRLQRGALLIPFCIAVFSLSALFYFHFYQHTIAVESWLQTIYAAIYRTFGFAPAVMFFLLLLIWTSIWFFTGRVERPLNRVIRLVAVLVMLGVFMNVGEQVDARPHLGELGAFFAARLVAAFGYYPSMLLASVTTLGALLLATDFLFSETFERLYARSMYRGAGGAKPASAKAAADEGVEPEVTDHLKGLASATMGSPAPATEAAPLRPGAAGGSGRKVRASDAAARDTISLHDDPAPAPAPERAVARDAADLSSDELAELVGERQSAPSEPAPVESAGASKAEPELADAEAYEFSEASDVPEVEPAVEDPVPDVVAEPRRARRRSYFERRYEEVRRSDARGAEAEAEAETEAETAESADATTSDAAEGAEPQEWLPVAPDSQEIDNPESRGVDEAPAAAGAILPAAGYGHDDGSQDDDGVDSEDREAAAEDADEPVFAIPRPEPIPDPEPAREPAREPGPEPQPESEAADAAEPAAEIEPAPSRRFRSRRERQRELDEEDGGRQQSLFGDGLDERLLDEARQVVLETRRASAAFLRRRLRIGYDEACDVLAELSSRGVIELGDDNSQGRVIDPN